MGLLIALKFPFLLLKLVANALAAAFRGIWSRPKEWSLMRYVKYAILRCVYSNQDLFRVITQRGDAGTLATYRSYMKKLKSAPEIVKIDTTGASGAWIGSPTAKNVLLYLHGGGYVSPAHPKHAEMLGELVKAARTQGKDLSVFFVEYGLGPKAQYPLQMIQGANSLNYLIEKAGYSPENIFVAGDSAGGNLAISLLSLISHPHPSAPEIDLKGKKLAGAFLISPWVTDDVTSSSMKSNLATDYLDHNVIRYSAAKFMGNAKRDNYSWPLDAPTEWWEDLQVQDICVLGAEYEIFVADVEAWTKKVQVHNPQAEFYLARAEVHVQAVVDRAMMLGIAESERHFQKWMLSRL